MVPCDPRDWTHPPFEAVVDDDGWLWGRGAVDMKNEVAARAVAMAELARSGFRPRGDLWLLAVADEEDGFADVGMRWLLEERPDIRPTHSINEGGGERLPLTDGREVVAVSVGEKGTLPVQVVALGEAGHASVPTLGNNAVPLLARLIARLGDGMPEPAANPMVSAMLTALLGRDEPDLQRAIAEAEALHPSLKGSIRALMGSTLAPTMLWGSNKRNVMPARATVEVDCRILPGTTQADVEALVRSLLGDDLPYALEWPEAIVEASSSPVDGRRPRGDRGLPGRRRRPRHGAADDVHAASPTATTSAPPPAPRRTGSARPGPRRSRCWTPATTTPTSGSTSTTCCCPRASTSTWPAGSSADRLADDRVPGAASTPDLRGLMLDYLDFLPRRRRRQGRGAGRGRPALVGRCRRAGHRPGWSTTW